MSESCKPNDELFQSAVTLVLRHEGGYVNDPDDSGGETKYGISKRSYPEMDIANLTRDDAIEIYRQDFWNPYPYPELGVSGGNPLAIKTFDLSVTMGARRAHKLLQEGIKDCGHAVIADGIIGPATLAAIRACDRDELLRNFQYQAISYYRSLGKPKYLHGWMNRVGDFEGVV